MALEKLYTRCQIRLLERLYLRKDLQNFRNIP